MSSSPYETPAAIIGPAKARPVSRALDGLDGALLGLAERVERAGPVLVGVALVVASLVLFAVNLDQPGELTFDETHYVPAGRALAAGEANFAPEHPMMGKMLIAWSLQVVGDHPIGWRLPSLVLSLVTIAAIFAFIWALTRNTMAALAGGVLALTNHFVFIHARIAMQDAMMAGFLFAAFAILAVSARAAWPRWGMRLAVLAAGVSLGLAAASKWAVLPYLPALGLTIILLRTHEAWAQKRLGPLRLVFGAGRTWWRGLSLVEIGLVLMAACGATYFVTFASTFGLERDALSWGEIIPFHQHMYARISGYLPPHPYTSQWWSWPLILRPIWYHYSEVDGVMRGVFMVGNPVIMLGGLTAALAAAAWGGLRRDALMVFAGVLALFAATYWALIPRQISFYYYYYLAGTLLSVPLAVVMMRACRWRGGRIASAAFMVAALGMFAYFYPMISAMGLPDWMSHTWWAWFRSWI